MKVYDISIPLNERTPVWPGDPKIRIETAASRAEGHEYHVSTFTLGAHNGTHVDAPYHFLEEGPGLTEIDISRFIMKTRVVEYPGMNPISDRFLWSLDIGGVQSILFKTSNSGWLNQTNEPFHKEFIALNESAAKWCVECGIELVGIDYLSIEPFGSENHEVHKLLLNNNIIILEGINLAGVAPANYQLICLPLKIAAPDGAPVRAVLVAE